MVVEILRISFLFFFRILIVSGLLTHTLLFKYPQSIKSSEVRSRECGRASSENHAAQDWISQEPFDNVHTVIHLRRSEILMYGFLHHSTLASFWNIKILTSMSERFIWALLNRIIHILFSSRTFWTPVMIFVNDSATFRNLLVHISTVLFFGACFLVSRKILVLK